jgi:hypothetical protein
MREVDLFEGLGALWKDEYEVYKGYWLQTLRIFHL